MEAEHPLLKVVSSQDNEANMFNNMNRMNIVPTGLVTHRIIGYRQANNKTYFTIKTSTNNKAIVENLLNGNAPGFSIRTKCTFSQPDENGHRTASNIEVIGIDYVANPANFESAKTSGSIKFIDTMNLKHVDLEMIKSHYETMQKLGTESVGISLESLSSGNSEVLYDPSSPTPVFVIRTKVDNKPKRSFEDAMRSCNLSLLS